MKNTLKKLSLCGFLMIAGLNAMAEQTYRVGSTPSGAPFTFLNAKNHQNEGVMTDIMAAIAKDNHFAIDVQPMPFGTLVPSLVSNKIDIISAAMSPTEPRKKVVDFSDEVYKYGEGVIVPASDTKVYHTIQDFKGDRVGAVVGTNYFDQLKATGLFSEIKAYDTPADILSDIRAGRLDAGFADGPILAYHFKTDPDPKLRYVETYKPFIIGLGISIAVRKDEPVLLKEINASIAKFKADGTLDKLLKKWSLQ